MTTEQYEELKRDMQELADRAGTCLNITDRQIMSKCAGHLLNYYFLLSGEVEE